MGVLCFGKTLCLVPVSLSPFQMPQSDLSRASSPSASSSDGDESSFFPISKREYLLAQLRQKDELIDSLLKQVCLSNMLMANTGAYCNLLNYLISSCTIHIWPVLFQSSNTAMQRLQMINIVKMLSRGLIVSSPPCARLLHTPAPPRIRSSSTHVSAKVAVSRMSQTKSMRCRGPFKDVLRHRVREIRRSHPTRS
jgi:hypothetical protein